MVSFQNLSNLSSTNFKAVHPCKNIAFNGTTSPLAPLEKDTFTKTPQPDIKIIKRDDGTIDHTIEQNGADIKTTYFNKDGKTVNSVNYYNENTKDHEDIFYQEDGKTLSAVNKGNTYTGDTRDVRFWQDGKTVCEISEGNLYTGNIKHTEYEHDGKTVKAIREDNFKK